MQQDPLSDVGLSALSAQWRNTEYGSDSLHAATTGSAAAADQGHPAAALDVAHVALAPGAGRGDLQPVAAGQYPPGLDAAASNHSVTDAAASNYPVTDAAASDPLGVAAAAAMRAPSMRDVEEEMGTASPSTFSSSFLGQSLDLSKVSLFLSKRTCQFGFVQGILTAGTVVRCLRFCSVICSICQTLHRDRLMGACN